MLSYVYYEDLFLEKQKYNHEKDESFSIQFAKILLVFFVLFLLWNGYSHYKQIDWIRNGTPVLAEVSVIGNGKSRVCIAAQNDGYAMLAAQAQDFQVVSPSLHFPA